VGASVSFRACPKILSIFFSSIPSLGKAKVPSRITVQRWMAKVGYYKLHSHIEKNDDWIILIDESIQVGSHKFLVILGCREKDLPRGRALNLEDLIPLHAVVQTKSDSDSILRALEVVKLRVGSIKGVCSDECSNLVNAVNLYRIENPDIVHIPDIVHKLANMLRKQLKDEVEWENFIKSVNTAKAKMYNTSIAYLAPPSLRGKSRFLNLDVLVDWASKTLQILKTGSHLKDYDPEYAEKHLGWLRQFEEPLAYYTNLVELACITRNLVREKGIYRHIADDFIIEFEKASPKEGWDVATFQVADQVYEFLEEQGNKIEKNRILLGSSEVIETFFGKYKSMQGNQTKAGFSGLVLAGLAHVGKIERSNVQDALETVTHTQVNDWVEEYVGVTVHAKRCKIFKKSTKCVKLMFEKISGYMGRELTGTIEGLAVGF
jgi:hypothetical protein